MPGFKKGVESFAAQLASPAAHFGPAKWRLRGGGSTIVQTNSPRFERLHQPKRSPSSARKRVRACPEGRGIGPLERFLFRLEREDRRDRRERLFARTERIVGDIHQHRGFEENPGATR